MVRTALLLGVALSLVGCASRESRVVGKWKGTFELSRSVERSPLGAMAKGFVGMADPQIDLKPDMTFTLYFGPVPLEGAWKFTTDGRSIELATKSAMGMNPTEIKQKADEGVRRMAGIGLPSIGLPMRPGEPLTLTLSDDWKTLSVEQPARRKADGFGDLKFTKV